VAQLFLVRLLCFRRSYHGRYSFVVDGCPTYRDLTPISHFLVRLARGGPRLAVAARLAGLRGSLRDPKAAFIESELAQLEWCSNLFSIHLNPLTRKPGGSFAGTFFCSRATESMIWKSFAQL
jgi:hypothetical protein